MQVISMLKKRQYIYITKENMSNSCEEMKKNIRTINLHVSGNELITNPLDLGKTFPNFFLFLLSFFFFFPVIFCHLCSLLVVLYLPL